MECETSAKLELDLLFFLIHNIGFISFEYLLHAVVFIN